MQKAGAQAVSPCTSVPMASHAYPQCRTWREPATGRASSVGSRPSRSYEACSPTWWPPRTA
eukprot:7792765-Alexandrium_andersonii.AAC.1